MVIPARPVLRILDLSIHRANVVEFKLRPDHIRQMEELRNRIAQIKKDEKELSMPSFTKNDAFKLGISIRNQFEEVYKQKNKERSASAGLPMENGIVIHIETATGMKIFSCVAGDESATNLDSWPWVEGMKNIVKRFHRSSYAVGLECNRNYGNVSGRSPMHQSCLTGSLA